MQPISRRSEGCSGSDSRGPSPTSRREFLGSLGAVGALALAGPVWSDRAARAAAAAPKVKLGLDNFAVRDMKWKAPALIDYAARLKTDSLFISDLDAFESLEPSHLAEIRKQAADKGLQIHLGTWSICPTSVTFRPARGSAEEHLRLGIRSAKALGSPVIRVVLGNMEDRKTPGGIEARIADTVAVCKKCRGEAIDAGVKIAVENHAGDMQAWELAGLVEEAGKDYVGVNLDAGNAVWTLEDPVASLEVLGPYAATTSLRDSVIWESANGVTVQWTAMGDGQVDWKTYFELFAKLCPGVPVHIETISGFNREFPIFKPDFWTSFPKARAKDLANFLALARAGKPRDPFRPPQGQDRTVAQQEYQRAEIEKSIEFCRRTFGFGPSAA